MRYYIVFLIMCSVSIEGITAQSKKTEHTFSSVSIETVLEDSISIRAITIDSRGLIYAGTEGKYGFISFDKEERVKSYHKSISWKGKKLHFRAIAATKEDFFILSIESPALLYKLSKKTGEASLVYKEEHPKAFYDAMAFWNDKEGIAIGDPTDKCLSVIITRDGGQSWRKVSCEVFPKAVEGEAAFAASNGNISIIDDQVWILSGGGASRVYHSSDKGDHWSVFDTPITQGIPTKGGYSLDFYDRNTGIIYGGDYTTPDTNQKNKVVTKDGGNTWTLVADGEGPGYRSCVRYIPNSEGKGVIAVGFKGISVSGDGGKSWKTISDASFYTLRFITDTIAYAAGKGRIAKLSFE